ncbi:16S rRNA (cytidine(1402)-2'-O)-methyltransferase [Balneolales bacterium ANBcel1]|nr:16S rRNA (cytidine(1402)-2'-O)-methyltransferase [Balneolales bacterium ANBcel1]
MATLYLVATPVGNLADFSLRSAEVLKSVHTIACEDTRTSSKLLQHYGITTPTVSFHQHNEHKKVDRLMDRLDSGQDIALISDAGTPGISDPGFLASREAHRRGHTVCAIPGASSATVALSASGLPGDRFLFEGFLPPKKGRASRLDDIADQACTVILFESVHRIEKLMNELADRCGETRMAAVCRELTKQFEEIIRGPLPEVARRISEHPHLKGEFVVVLAGKNYEEQQ